MKQRTKRLVAMVISFVLVIMCCNCLNNATVEAAAAPKLNVTKKTIYERGTKYQLTVKNKPKNVTYEWSSSKESVATVNGLGMVTALKKGNTLITCKIKYKDSSIVKLTCNITVKIAATEVKINNAQIKNNAHHMSVGDTYDFNRTLTPSGSSDKTYWVIDEPSIAMVDSNGVVTALTEGNVTLQARTGASKAKAMNELNTVTDAIIINITKTECSVVDFKFDSAKEVRIIFSHPMSESSLISNYGYLSSNVTVEAKTINGVAAKDPGVIKGKLSNDGKELTLTATNNWSGTYNFKIASNAITQSGIEFKGYNEDKDLSDKDCPVYVGTTLDDTGMIASINFSEPIDITNLQKPVLRSDMKVGPSTTYVLTTISNYKLSQDKKALTIDLSMIDTVDRNKSIAFSLSGIKDLQGNWTNPYINEVYVLTDTTTKTNASLLRVERTSKNTLTAVFSSSIQTTGYMKINGTLIPGTVDLTDRKRVNYTITEPYSSMTTNITGTIYGWCSYNSITYGSDTNFTVDMSSAASVPQLVTNSFTSIPSNGGYINTLYLTFNKDVNLVATSGKLRTTYSDYNGNVIPYEVGYTATVTGKDVTLVLEQQNTSAVGYYTLTIPAYFVYDTYGNYNQAATATISITKTTSSPLPAPTKVIQTTADRSVFEITFPTKIDPVSAQVVTNYTLGNINPAYAEVISNSETGAIVKITFPVGTITSTMQYPFSIKNITGYNNAYEAMKEYSNYFTVYENAAPVLVDAKLVGNSMINLEFSENIVGTPSFNVIQNGVLVPLNSAQSCYISGKTVVIVLSTTVTANNLTVSPTSSNYLTDENANRAIVPSSRTVTY